MLNNKLMFLWQKISPYFSVNKQSNNYLRKFKKYAFYGNKCKDEKQYEAVITRWCHTIEKGLSYLNYRAGFGEKNIDALLEAMENYIMDGYSQDAFFFRTALCTLNVYIQKNKEYGLFNIELEKRIHNLGGIPNNVGGIIKFIPKSPNEIKTMGYKEFFLDRHSLRHFSNEKIEINHVKSAIELAQHTPSACNRQGWRTRVINNKKIIQDVLLNQNGNKGFGHEFDKLLVITSDIRYFNRDREIFQAFIDGGMYAQSVLNALHYEHIASVPLSASLNDRQEKNIRSILNLYEAEILILLIGLGNYPNECQTARSERKNAEIEII